MGGRQVCVQTVLFPTIQSQKNVQAKHLHMWCVQKGWKDGLRSPLVDFFIKEANRKKDFHTNRQEIGVLVLSVLKL